jgi:hypothetical protein
MFEGAKMREVGAHSANPNSQGKLLLLGESGTVVPLLTRGVLVLRRSARGDGHHHDSISQEHKEKCINKQFIIVIIPSGGIPICPRTDETGVYPEQSEA